LACLALTSAIAVSVSIADLGNQTALAQQLGDSSSPAVADSLRRMDAMQHELDDLRRILEC
jgi:hypothetical protein